MQGVQAGMKCSIVGNCGRNIQNRDDKWIQFCSSEITNSSSMILSENISAVALCFPSVKTEVQWLQCFTSRYQNDPTILGIVTKISKNRIYEVNSAPVIEVSVN